MADHRHDIAVSFSGAQRSYVERVVRACEAAGLRVFYDKDASVALWGRNVITELRKVYGGTDTRYVVAFLSREYLAGAYPMDEFRYATLSALYREDYLLPVMRDDVEVPPESQPGHGLPLRRGSRAGAAGRAHRATGRRRGVTTRAGHRAGSCRTAMCRRDCRQPDVIENCMTTYR